MNEHTQTDTRRDNGRYRIPNDNPFVGVAGMRKQTWAYGFRNPHRLSWAIDPQNPATNHLTGVRGGTDPDLTVRIAAISCEYL